MVTDSYDSCWGNNDHNGSVSDGWGLISSCGLFRKRECNRLITACLISNDLFKPFEFDIISLSKFPNLQLLYSVFKLLFNIQYDVLYDIRKRT